MHLFLEGPIQTGKSTLLRECLAPYSQLLGGFSCQRIWKEGQPCGYRLTAASDFCLDTEYQPGLEDIFLYHFGEISKKDPSVFELKGVQLLEHTKNRPLILLDEIGGAELLSPSFKQTLYHILEGSIPCIGVLKLSSKAGFMSPVSGFPGEVIDHNLQLRQKLSQIPGCKLISFSRENKASIKKEIQIFLEKIFY